MRNGNHYQNGKSPVQAGLKIPVISFFTGGGFLDMGFEMAGFEVVWTNEVNSTFADLYEAGMKSWRNSMDSSARTPLISDRRSLEEIRPAEISTAAFANEKPRIFGVIGGPPCPDFSCAGKNQGGTGKNGRLSKTFVRYICALKPAFFVFENVPGLYRTKIHREFLQKLEEDLERNGYKIDLKILNSLELGLPQDRERLVMIGIEKSLFKNSPAVENIHRGWFPWPFDARYSEAKTKYEWPRKVARGKKPTRPAGIPPELTVSTLLRGNNPPRLQPNGNEYFKPYSKKFTSVREGDTNRKSFKRLHRYRFSPTVCYGNNEVHLHPWKDRRLSVREAMRIQGIPDSYALPKEATLSAKFSVVSNGVPVPLGREVASSMLTFLKTVVGHSETGKYLPATGKLLKKKRG